MSVNVGTFDRAIRIILGLALIIVPFVGGFGIFEGMISKIIAVAIGAVFVLTALAGNCPLYSLLGIRTCNRGA